MAEKANAFDETVENDSTSIVAPTKGQRVKSHFKKWWWAYLIGFCCVVLVVVLPIVYVGYPNIARDGIASSSLVPTRLSFTEPSPTGFMLELDTILESDSSYHPTLYPFNGSLYLDGGDTSFASISIPELKAQNGTVINIAQMVTIADQAQFTNFCITALSSETYTLRLRGDGDLKLGGLPTINVDYNQPVVTKGLNSFEGLTIETFFLQIGQDLPGGANSNGTVLVPNPSVLTLDVGDASFAISVAGTPIGNVTLPDLTLTPGNNTYPMNVNANITAVTDLLHQDAYRCGKLPVDITGIESVYNGEVLPYFTEALQHNSVRATLDLGPALEAVGLEAQITGECTT